MNAEFLLYVPCFIANYQATHWRPFWQHSHNKVLRILATLLPEITCTTILEKRTNRDQEIFLRKNLPMMVIQVWNRIYFVINVTFSRSKYVQARLRSSNGTCHTFIYTYRKLITKFCNMANFQAIVSPHSNLDEPICLQGSLDTLLCSCLF